MRLITQSLAPHCQSTYMLTITLSPSNLIMFPHPSTPAPRSSSNRSIRHSALPLPLFPHPFTLFFDFSFQHGHGSPLPRIGAVHPRREHPRLTSLHHMKVQWLSDHTQDTSRGSITHPAAVKSPTTSCIMVV